MCQLLHNKIQGGILRNRCVFQMFIISFQIGYFVSGGESAYFIYPHWRNICFALNVTPLKSTRVVESDGKL